MPTVEEVLRESGFTSDQVAALDQRAVGAFTTILSTAEQARQAAETAQRANVDWYEGKIVPALVGWEEEKQRLDNERAQVAAQAAFYRTQAEEAKKSGFIAADAPGFVPQQRDAGGKYVSGVPGSTPGSPTYFDVNQIYQRAGDAVSILTDIQWEHQKLFGQPLPISPGELVKRADAVKLDPRAYAAREFGWDARRQEVQKRQVEDHDSEVRREAVAENDKKWAERVGSNPDLRRPMASPQMTEVAKAVKSGTAGLADPLLLNEAQRRTQTSQMIRQEIAEAEK
jgi:hypothetical protein